MHPVVNHLIQLQELQLIRDEQRVTAKGKSLTELDASIKTMTANLPAETRVLYTKLQKRDHISVTTVRDSMCTGCGLLLAISFVQQVRMEKEILTCPNCSRVLYNPERIIRRMEKGPRRVATRKPGLSRFSSHSLIIPRLKAKTKEEAILELATSMAEVGFVDNAENMTAEALARESVLSTAVDHGMAFPHVRGIDGGGLSLALGLSPKGINFDNDGPLSKIIFLISIPTAASAFYLKLLAGLMETFRQAEARKTLMAENDPEKVWKTLIKLTRTTIK
ncbi:MAG: PTS system nitrogen regulatory IIA component [Candidatus Promineifilaceae bacterium]|jgi:mannitol/fructose-specific phosphotransferase system IIA component (Ntr-type)/RNase P subunit RPR2